MNLNHQNIISTKQLRENFPQIKRDLGAGETFLLLYRSKPIAEIRPFSVKKKFKSRVSLNDLAGGFNLGKGYSPEEMTKLFNTSYK